MKSRVAELNDAIEAQAPSMTREEFPARAQARSNANETRLRNTFDRRWGSSRDC
jgi:hypothetical protein